MKARQFFFQFPAVGNSWQEESQSKLNEDWTPAASRWEAYGTSDGRLGCVAPGTRDGQTSLLRAVGFKLPQMHFPSSGLGRTLRVLCFRRRPVFLCGFPAPPIPLATGRGFRVKVDQFPSLAPTRAFGPPEMTDSSRAQPDTVESCLRQGRYGDEGPGPIILQHGGVASMPAPDRCYRHSFCQMRAEEGRYLGPGPANEEGSRGGPGVPGGGSSAPSRGAASRWGYREASAGVRAASWVGAARKCTRMPQLSVSS
jgi:hypothetical protein